MLKNTAMSLHTRALVIFLAILHVLAAEENYSGSDDLKKNDIYDVMSADSGLVYKVFPKMKPAQLDTEGRYQDYEDTWKENESPKGRLRPPLYTQQVYYPADQQQNYDIQKNFNSNKIVQQQFYGNQDKSSYVNKHQIHRIQNDSKIFKQNPYESQINTYEGQQPINQRYPEMPQWSIYHSTPSLKPYSNQNYKTPWAEFVVNPSTVKKTWNKFYPTPNLEPYFNQNYKKPWTNFEAMPPRPYFNPNYKKPWKNVDLTPNPEPYFNQNNIIPWKNLYPKPNPEPYFNHNYIKPWKIVDPTPNPEPYFNQNYKKPWADFDPKPSQKLNFSLPYRNSGLETTHKPVILKNPFPSELKPANSINEQDFNQINSNDLISFIGKNRPTFINNLFISDEEMNHLLKGN